MIPAAFDYELAESVEPYLLEFVSYEDFHLP